MKKEISTRMAPEAIGPYSQAVKAGDFLYISGQLPIDPNVGTIVEGGIESQVNQVLQNLNAILKEADMSFENVIKTTVLLTDLGDFATVNQIYAQYFNGEVLPARAAFQVAALPKAAMVEIELVAYRG